MQPCVGYGQHYTGGVLRHILPLKKPVTPSPRNEHVQVARDDSLGSSHERSRNMAREACTAQVVVASPSHSEGDGAADVVSLLDPSNFFSDLEQPVATPSTLDRALADFDVEETTGPPLSETMAFRVRHILKTPLPPEKLKLCMDREFVLAIPP